MVPDSKVHVANMGPIWGRQDPGGPNVGPMNFAIWVVFFAKPCSQYSFAKELVVITVTASGLAL